jgi:hypothetical protein
MCSIESLGISGIRGYSPEGYQKINFLKPLTLIWGKNGSGKTVLIFLFRPSSNVSSTSPLAHSLPTAIKAKASSWTPKSLANPKSSETSGLSSKLLNNPYLSNAEFSSQPKATNPSLNPSNKSSQPEIKMTN